LPVLLSKLCDAGYSVSLETSGAIDIAGVDQRVSRVLDIKTPGSAEVDRNLWATCRC
jgi:7-carboxy-7-deazaguanine synthase